MPIARWSASTPPGENEAAAARLTAAASGASGADEHWARGLQRAVMTGVSYMIPFVAAGGLLLATALGLVAAIPAVMIYNHLVRGVTSYRALLGDASAQVMLLISRDHGRRGSTTGACTAALRT